MRRTRTWTAAVGAVVLSLAVHATTFAADGNHFYRGYCTWAASELAHRTWGVWVPWFGDAGDWAVNAQAAGWSVSPVPEVNSIAVMPRGVQGSGPDGHVGWVIAVDPDGIGVTLQSMNWSGFGVVSQHRIVADGQVQFVTPPSNE